MSQISDFSSVLEVSFALSSIGAYVSRSYRNQMNEFEREFMEMDRDFKELLAHRFEDTIAYRECLTLLYLDKGYGKIYVLTAYAVYINAFVSISLLLFSGFNPTYGFTTPIFNYIFVFLLYFPITYLLFYKFLVERFINRFRIKLDNLGHDLRLTIATLASSKR